MGTMFGNLRIGCDTWQGSTFILPSRPSPLAELVEHGISTFSNRHDPDEAVAQPQYNIEPGKI